MDFVKQTFFLQLISARQLLKHFASQTIIVVLLIQAIIHADSATISPRTAKKEAISLSRTKVVLEVQGEIQHNVSGDVKKDKPRPGLPLKAIANLAYDEKIFRSQKDYHSLRFYHEAVTNIEVNGRTFKRQLRDDRSVVHVAPQTPAATRLLITSPAGSLTRNELELLTVPTSSLHIDSLLSPGKLKLNDSLTHSDELLARLLNLDAVNGNDVISKVAKIEKDKVRFTIFGKVVGAVDGVVSDIELNGKYNYDRKLERITWMAVTIKEERDSGATSPGFNVTARIRIVVADNTERSFIETSEAALANPSTRLPKLLEYAPDSSNFRFTHGRDWHIWSEGPQRSILRLVTDGETIAQCNVRELKSSDVQKVPSLKEFTAEIKKNLKNSQPQVVQADETTNLAGMKILRAVVVGVVSKTDIQWIYYLAVDKKSRGVSYVFTMGVDAAEDFGTRDSQITQSLQLVAPPESRQAGRQTLQRK